MIIPALLPHPQGQTTEHNQARSQKFAMGVWGRSPQLPEAGGLGAKPPAAGGTEALENFAFFCKNNFILGLF